MKLKFLRAVFWFWMGSGGYYAWSKLIRWILEGRYDGVLTKYTRLEQLEKALGEMKWVQDPLKGMFDVISKPEKVEHIYQIARVQGKPAEIGDCDEFACYAAVCIKDMISRGILEYGVASFMTVNWLDKDNGFHGHNICVFFDYSAERWAHISNWFNGEAQGGFETLEDLAAWWPKQDEGQMIGWALATPDLRPFRLEIG